MSSRKVKKGVGTQRRAEVSATALGNGDSTSPSSLLGVPRPSAMPPHASSSSPPGAPQPPSAPPQASFPNSARGLWPRFDNGAGQYSHGNQSTNPWGFPQGGFVNFINQNQFPEPPSTSENFHLVGLTQSFSPFCPPSTPYPKGTPTAPPPPAAPNVVNLDTEADVVEESRTAKKSRTARHWTPDEEKRLASAWLNTSKDPIYGNDKSRDTFWGQISNEFNKNIQEHLKRDINQLKIHWGRLHKSMTEFNGFFSKVSKINTSGYSDDMLIDEAHQMWQKKYGKRFTLEHWWKKLKNEPKWTASIAQSEKEKNKGENDSACDDGAQVRPIGREAAKAQRKGKTKMNKVKDGISMLGDNINKIAEITEERKKERDKVTEAQLEISRNQLKVTEAQLKTAKEQKEAKLLEAYTSLLVQDTSQMTQEEKACRQIALTSITSKLFGNHEETA